MSITVDSNPSNNFEYDKDIAENVAVSTPKCKIPSEEQSEYVVNDDPLSYDSFEDDDLIESTLFFEVTTVEGNFITISTGCIEAVEESVHPDCGKIARIYMTSGTVFEVKNSYKSIVEKL